MVLAQNCPFCGKETTLEVNEESYTAYQNGLEIISAFPDVDVFGREFIITGMCYSCQEKTFHKPLPQHALAWGKLLGECDCCGANIYEKEDLGPDGKYRCATCGETYDKEGFRTAEDVT